MVFSSVFCCFVRSFQQAWLGSVKLLFLLFIIIRLWWNLECQKNYIPRRLCDNTTPINQTVRIVVINYIYVGCWKSSAAVYLRVSSADGFIAGNGPLSLGLVRASGMRTIQYSLVSGECTAKYTQVCHLAGSLRYARTGWHKKGINL